MLQRSFHICLSAGFVLSFLCCAQYLTYELMKFVCLNMCPLLRVTLTPIEAHAVPTSVDDIQHTCQLCGDEHGTDDIRRCTAPSLHNV